MLNYLNKIIKRIGLSDDTRKTVFSNYEKIKNNDPKSIRKFLSSCKANSSLIEITNKFYNNNKKLNINRFEFDLLAVLLLTRKIHKFYRKKHIKSRIFFEFIKDIAYKVEECISVKKTHGIFALPWYQRFLEARLFSFGRLEFELTKFGKNIDDIFEDDIAIGIHIPKNGEKLSQGLVLESLDTAEKYFKKYLKTNKLTFKCCSWLLFPENEKFLSKESNIIRFSKMFKIIETYYFDDYTELWRIFGCEITDVNKLTDNTSLTHGYIEMMRKKEKIGASIGYFVK